VKRVIIIRYGGFGDALQAASILPGLKNEGWDITWDASEQGFELLKSDPLIDALLLTPHGSVPDADLGEYWNARTNGFNRVINLCESVENSSLMKPNVLGFFHDDETRRRLHGDTGYVEHIHLISGVSGPFLPRYCPETDEIDAANRVLGPKNIVLALAGSAEYKVWPHAPAFVSRVLAETDAKIFLAGGSKDAGLAQEIVDFVAEEGKNDPNRVVNLTNSPVRAAFAVAWQSDVVVGPETGIMNAVAASAGRKIVLLSHSSPRNLTQHWLNTMAIQPSVACHPCHRLHQTTKFCPRGPSGGFAACAESISPDVVLAVAIDAIKGNAT
jgi:ADP-heptose:LPS heptosyltransferase